MDEAKINLHMFISSDHIPRLKDDPSLSVIENPPRLN